MACDHLLVKHIIKLDHEFRIKTRLISLNPFGGKGKGEVSEEVKFDQIGFRLLLR